MHEPCQVCGGTDLEEYVRRQDGHYLRCRACSLVWNPDADRLLAEARETYDAPWYFEGYARRFERKVRSASRRLAVVAEFAPGGKLLDIGCGSGDTLVAARTMGFEASGLDVGTHPVQHCAELGFEVHQASVIGTGLPEGSYDVVTMWDVIEHIPRSKEGLREVCRILRPGGVAALIAPSSAYLKAHLLRRTYKAYGGLWAKTHFVYHTPQTLARVLRDCGLEPLALPVLRSRALAAGGFPAVTELAATLPRALAARTKQLCRLDRNVFVVARKPK